METLYMVALMLCNLAIMVALIILLQLVFVWECCDTEIIIQVTWIPVDIHIGITFPISCRSCVGNKLAAICPQWSIIT